MPREEVAGPYRSQSSVPSIRRKATRREHRKVNPLDILDVPDLTSVERPAAPRPTLNPARLLGAMANLVPPAPPMGPSGASILATTQGVQPTTQQREAWQSKYWREKYGPDVFDLITQAAIEKTRSEENLGEPEDLTNLATLIGGGLGGAALKAAIGRGAATAASESGLSSFLAGSGRLPTALRGAAKVASFPVRRPIITTAGGPLALQAPVAAKEGDPGELLEALEGTGVAATALANAGGAVSKAVPGVLGNAAGDALSLPAQVLPSVYLTGKAGLEAAAGDPSEAEGLIREYGETSFLPALLQGDIPEAFSRIGEHPLYAALEGAAVKSAVGRGAGAAARTLGGARGQEIAGPAQRPPLNVYGDVQQQRRPYSPDLIKRTFEKRSDARRETGPNGELLATPREVSKHLRSALDREVFSGEQVRRGNQRQIAHELGEVKPADSAQADVVSHAIQGIARNPDRALFDLQDYKDQLVAQQPNLTASELTANRKQIETIDAALTDPNPDAIYNAARTFVEQQRPITEGLVERGLLDPEQARKATAIPYARTHMDAGYGLSRADRAEEAAIKEGLGKDRNIGELSAIRAKSQTLDRAGDPLPLEAIETHMREGGLEPGDFGFVTQRPAPASGQASFFQPPNERASLPRQRRSGEATTRGTFDPSWDAVVQQAIHGRTVLDRVQNFEHLVERFGLRAPDGRAFKDSAEAKRAAEHPEDFGMRLPEVPGGWRPMRLSPWLAKKSEVDAASDLGHNFALEADQHQMIENFSVDAIRNALEPGDGPVVLIPKVVSDRMRQHFQEVYPVEKAAQAITGAFKGAILPTSPKWAAGNALDNFVIRSFSTGITPRDMVSGKRFAKIFKDELSPEEQARALESIVPGGLYGSYARVQPYRALEQFVGTRIEPFARAAHAVLTAPGVRTVAELYRRYRDTVFELDSKYVEQLPQYGQLAKSARQELGMTRRQFRKAIDAQDAVVKDFVRGFRHPENVDRFAKEVEAVFGNWGKNGPEARRFLTTWAPFWMWGRSAIKFAFVTLPRDHPMLTGLLAASEQMTREERQKLGFDFAGDEPLPDFLQGGIPDGSGGVTALGSLSTFGTFADLPQFLASMPAPQFSSLVLSGLGLDWKGDKLVDKDGRPAGQLERIKAAVLGWGDAFVPFLNVGRAITERGSGGVSPFRSYPESTADYLRSLHNTQQINVPITESGSSGTSNPLDVLDEQLGESGGNPLDVLDLP